VLKKQIELREIANEQAIKDSERIRDLSILSESIGSERAAEYCRVSGDEDDE
jgi:hypothetical protein